MKKEKLLCICLILFSFLCYGCAGNTVQDNSLNNLIRLNSDGTISVVLYESFDKDYYNIDELRNMAQDEINSFNAAHGSNKIMLGEVKTVSSDVKLVSLELIFADSDSFNNYMPNKIFTGTISGAMLSGYDLNRSLCVVGHNKSTIGKNDLTKMSDDNVIIVNGAYDIETPGKVTYYSQGMDYLNTSHVSASLNGIYFVMYK